MSELSARLSIAVVRHVKLVAALLIASVAAACSSGSEPPSARSIEPTPTERAASGPGALLYLDGTTLHALSLSDGTDEVVGQVPTADVALSPDGARFAVIREGSAEGSDDEGFGDPRVMLGEIGAPAGELTELGPGRGPLWSPDGAFVAAITRAEGHTICPGAADREKDEDDPEAAGCVEGERVTSYPVAEATTEGLTAIGSGTWSIIGWTFDHHILAASRHNDAVLLGFPGATFEQIQNLTFTPDQVWGISPTEPTLFVLVDGRTVLTTAAGEGGGGKTIDVDLTGIPGDGAWSPTGAHIAVVAVGSRGGATGLVVIDSATGAVTEVDGSKGAQGNVVWSTDGQTFAYTRVDPDARGSLQAVACTVDLRCDALFSWDEGVRLLGFGP